MVVVVLSLPFFLQGMVIAVDEFYFHHKRGLGRWEILGHPLDTFSVILALLVPAFSVFSGNALFVFALLAGLSSLLVTKDEFVHAPLCSPVEMWLHSLLFLLHPLVFVAAGVLWWLGGAAAFSAVGFQVTQESSVSVLRFQLVALALFFLYQLAFWGPKWPQKTT